MGLLKKGDRSVNVSALALIGEWVVRKTKMIFIDRRSMKLRKRRGRSSKPEASWERKGIDRRSDEYRRIGFTSSDGADWLTVQRDQTNQARGFPEGFWWKVWLDRGILCLGIPVVLLVMLLLWIAIKLVSPGSAIFVQWRIGYLRRPFKCYKFRTMELNSECAPHVDHLVGLASTGAPLRKLDRNDRRLIPLGRWIRASGLDELPQVWNVLRGEMSFVGPRPCTDYELPCFVGEGLDRFAALPGLTGLWQVCGKNETTFVEMLRLDSSYVRNCSLALDLKILARTPVVIIDQVLRVGREYLSASVKLAASS